MSRHMKYQYTSRWMSRRRKWDDTVSADFISKNDDEDLRVQWCTVSLIPSVLHRVARASGAGVFSRHVNARTRTRTPVEIERRVRLPPHRVDLSHLHSVILRIGNRLSGHYGVYPFYVSSISRYREHVTVIILKSSYHRRARTVLTCLRAYARVCQRTRASDTDLMSRISESCFTADTCTRITIVTSCTPCFSAGFLHLTRITGYWNEICVY